MRLDFSPPAEIELLAERENYEAQREGLGAEFADELEQLLARIAEAPLQFPKVPRSRRHRRAVLERFPFNLIFEIAGDRVRIIALAPQSKRPHYWRGRS